MSESRSPYERTYTASQVAEIVGMNPETLRVWRRRKHVVLEGDRPGWTRFTFNDLMLVAAYHNLVASNCTNAFSELVAARIHSDLGDKWGGILGAESGVFCFCNANKDGTEHSIETIVGVGELTSKIKATLRNPRRNPTYHIVDCMALFLQVLRKVSALDKDTT